MDVQEFLARAAAIVEMSANDSRKSWLAIALLQELLPPSIVALDPDTRQKRAFNGTARRD